MSNETDLINLYSTKILSLAAKIALNKRLINPHATVRKHSPICGSTVIVDIKIINGVVIEYGQDVKACALGQAAASVLGQKIIGLSVEEIKIGRDQLSHMLTNDGPIPDAPFEGFKPLKSAKTYTNRHSSIMLAIEATLDAIDQCEPE
jgi:NifU-like protein involved in Fe-S cluster formation|tara:strand:+ start:903 stop:1346 length:444 start_codon:yes stop_codon:yes gene_type:complete